MYTRSGATPRSHLFDFTAKIENHPRVRSSLATFIIRDLTLISINMPPKKSTRFQSLTTSAVSAQSESSFHFAPTSHSLSTIPPPSILVHSTNCFGEWGAGVALAIHKLFPEADKVYKSHCDSYRPRENAWPSKAGLLGTALLIPPQKGDIKSNGSGQDKNGMENGVWIACLFTSYGYGRPSKRKAGVDCKADIRSQTVGALKDLRRLVGLLQRGEYEVVDEDGVGRIFKENSENSKKRKRSREDEGIEDEGIKDEGSDGDGKGETESVESRDKLRNTAEIQASGTVVTVELERESTQKLQLDIHSPLFNSGSFGIKWEETKGVIEEIFKDWNGSWYVISPPKRYVPGL